MKDSLLSQFALPPLPEKLNAWFEFARQHAEMDWYLDADYLAGVSVTDVGSALVAMDGYRFVLDQHASTAQTLVWHDQVPLGQWNEYWLVIENIGGDPIIADIGRPQVPVLFDRHGRGKWSPEVLFDSIDELIASIAIEQPHVPSGVTHPRYTVTLTDLGSSPHRVLLALKRESEFAQLPAAELLALKQKLPIVLLKEDLSESLAQRIADRYRENGGDVDIIVS